MLHYQTVTPFLLKTLQKLMLIPELSNFRLAGGTGLSLQLGHRKSIDIDLFSDEKIIPNELKKIIRTHFFNADIRTLSFGITAYIPIEKEKELKIDIMQTDNFIKPPVIANNIRLATIEDIAAMKLEAITSRNTKKDYYDIAEILKKYTINQIIEFYSQKYPYNDVRDVLENLIYFSEECEYEFDPELIVDTDWLSVKFLLEAELDNYINGKL